MQRKKPKLYDNLLSSMMNIDPAALTSTLNMQSDLSAVRGLLANKVLMHDLLAQLEQQLVRFVGDLYHPATRTLARDYMNRQQAVHHHILRRYCAGWATSHGFHNVIKLTNVLSRNDFASMLKSQSLFKDNTFKGNDHTSLGHFWQWWCITEYAAAHPGWLSCAPAELYRKMGEQNAFDWDNTFEFYLDVSRMRFMDSYSRIETFGGFLLSDEAANAFPVLHQLTIRSEKHINTDKDDVPSTMNQSRF